MDWLGFRGPLLLEILHTSKEITEITRKITRKITREIIAHMLILIIEPHLSPEELVLLHGCVLAESF